MTIDDNGIPKTAEEHVAAAEKILERAARLGVPAEDVVIDPLVLTVGAEHKAALVILQSIDLVRRNLGTNINLGASNVSFGLPDRPTINCAFPAMVIQAGATCSITDPIRLINTVRPNDLLLGRDEFALRYLKYFRTVEKPREQEAAKTADQ